jgi:small subunit ribosomal protein S7
MPRRKSPPKRITPPDNKYQSLHVAMLINRMMTGGKKSTAQGIMYTALDLIEERAKRNPIDLMEQGLRNVAPAIEVKPMRVGGATYQVPVEVPGERSITLAMRWILDNARKRGGRSMAEKLAGELMDAANGQGASVKKKDDTHRMAEANRAFAHFR